MQSFNEVFRLTIKIFTYCNHFIMRVFLTLTILIFIELSTIAQDSMPAIPVVCYFNPENSFTQVLPDNATFAKSRLAATSNIEVTYIDFPEQAKVPFEYAISLWEKYLVSSQTIRIKATWSKSLANNVLAETYAARVYKLSSSTPNLPYANVWYPTPLAEALSGKDLNSGDYDMFISLNANINWSYLTNAQVVAGKFDMVTVLLHEISHGLGFSSSMTVINNDTQGQYGQLGSAYIFDVYMKDSKKVNLTNTGIYGNPSTDLKTALTSNVLYFGVKNSALANSLPRLYAPATFKSGSSFSHFDEGTYPVGSANSLMTPNVRAAEVNHTPGDLLLNCLYTIGWQVNGLTGLVTGTESLPENIFEILVFPNPVENLLNVAIPNQAQARTIKIDLFNQNGRILQEIEKQNVNVETFQIDLSNYEAGLYFLQVLDGEKKTVRKIIK